MSLHVELSPEAHERLRIQRRNSSISSCLVAFLFLILVGLILGFFLLKPTVKEAPVIVTYQSNTETETEPDAKKVQTSMERKPSAPSSNTAKVIAASTMSTFSIPVPEQTVAEPSLSFGDGDDFGTGWGNGDGDGAGGGGGGFGSGNAGSGGLMGFIYDLKQDNRKRPIHYDTGTFPGSMVKIQNGGFSDRVLSNYFRSPDPLYLTRLAIPKTDANDGPKLFKVDRYIKPKGWFAHYSGSVIAPKSGRFRFVGAGDDYLMVSINGKPILHASYSVYQEETAQGWKPSESPIYPVPYDSEKLRSGDWINLRAGEEVKLTVSIGERPGGFVWFILMVEESGVDYKKAANGRPILPLFTTASISTEEVAELKKQFPSFEFEFEPDKVPVFRQRK